MPYKDKNKEDKCKKQWAEKNKENILKASRRYYAIHKEDIKLRSKLWRQNNKDAFNESLRKYRKTPSGIYATIIMNAKKRKIEVKLNKKEFIQWYDLQKQCCYYCKIKNTDLYKLNFLPSHTLKHITRLTIDRLDNMKGYEINNICLACSLCNMLKSDFFSEKEMLEIADRFIAPKLILL